ncbi:hypothetical protein GGI43DRAFT_432864 [Trichoderma evansii]
MIGDSADSDIKGALDAQLAAIMYSPTAYNSQKLLFGQQIPIIRQMTQLLGHFGIASPRFKPHFVSVPGQLVIEGIGIDLVTEPRRYLQISKEGVQFLAERTGMVLDCTAQKRHIPAMSHIESMIRTIAKAAGLINEEMIQISFPGRELGEIITVKPTCHVTGRYHSMRAEYVRLALDTVSENEATLREVASLLQGHCNYLMGDYPKAAIRQLRCAMLILAEQAGIRQNTIITGEQID